MIAQRFRSIGWVAGCAVAALGCYLASQTVASERAALARVDRRIAAAQDDIRRLNTEIAARGRMGQIERWNSEVLALQAPAPGQFVADEVQLASLASGRPLPLDPAIVASKGAVTVVAYQAPPVPAPAQTVAAVVEPAPAQPLLRTATYVQPKPSPLAAGAAAPIVKASLTVTPPAAPVFRPARPERAAVREDGKPRLAKASLTIAAAKPVLADREAARPKAAKSGRIADEDDGAGRTARLVKVAAVVPAKTGRSLLPSDLGTLIAAEKDAKASKPATTRSAPRPTDR